MSLAIGFISNFIALLIGLIFIQAKANLADHIQQQGASALESFAGKLRAYADMNAIGNSAEKGTTRDAAKLSGLGQSFPDTACIDPKSAESGLFRQDGAGVDAQTVIFLQAPSIVAPAQADGSNAVARFNGRVA